MAESHMQWVGDGQCHQKYMSDHKQPLELRRTWNFARTQIGMAGESSAACRPSQAEPIATVLATGYCRNTATINNKEESCTQQAASDPQMRKL